MEILLTDVKISRRSSSRCPRRLFLDLIALHKSPRWPDLGSLCAPTKLDSLGHKASSMMVSFRPVNIIKFAIWSKFEKTGKSSATSPIFQLDKMLIISKLDLVDAYRKYTYRACHQSYKEYLSPRSNLCPLTQQHQLTGRSVWTTLQITTCHVSKGNKRFFSSYKQHQLI